MTMISCPECRKKISNTAVSCPNCGYLLTSDKIDKFEIKKQLLREKINETENAIAEIEKKEPQAPGGCGIISLSIIVILVILYMIDTCSSDSPKDTTPAKTEATRTERREDGRKGQDYNESPKSISKTSDKPLTIGVSYDQITESFHQFMAISQSTPVRGQKRYMGETSDQTVIIEIIGDKQDVSQVSLIVGMPSDTLDALNRNITLLLRLVKNTIPEWEASADWVTSAAVRVLVTGESEVVIKGQMVIRLSPFGGLPAVVFLTIEHSKSVSSSSNFEKVSNDGLSDISAQSTPDQKGIGLSRDYLIRALSERDPSFPATYECKGEVCIASRGATQLVMSGPADDVTGVVMTYVVSLADAEATIQSSIDLMFLADAIEDGSSVWLEEMVDRAMENPAINFEVSKVYGTRHFKFGRIQFDGEWNVALVVW